MTDFLSDFEREARRNERAVDEYRHVAELEAEVERRRDEADRERLARRDAERWLAAIRTAIGDVSRDCPNWDGSPAGLATAVASKTRRLEEEAAGRSALLGRLEALRVRWRSQRAALVRQANADDRSESRGQAFVAAELLHGCIDGLEGAIKGDEREVNP